jgi:hypothetical protein
MNFVQIQNLFELPNCSNTKNVQNKDLFMYKNCLIFCSNLSFVHMQNCSNLKIVCIQIFVQIQKNLNSIFFIYQFLSNLEIVPFLEYLDLKIF